ncbi:MAG: response regulator [Gaiellales bacterium]
MPPVDDRERFRRLVETGIQITSELSLDSVLRRLVDAAAELAGARYAALGVLDRSGETLERFLTAGVDAATVATIGEPPHARGILGVLTREARPLRLHDVTRDSRSVGFPPGHPRMRTFLGVPIVLRGTVYGNLYLCEKQSGEDFTDDDEELATLLAAQAAVAIDNARLYESATRWLRRLESMTEVGNALAAEFELPRLLELISVRLRELVRARSVFVALPTPDGDLRIEAAADDHDINRAVGLRIGLAGSKSGRVYERRKTERVDSVVDDPEIDERTLRDFAEQAELPIPTTGLYVPLLFRERAIGVIVIHDKFGDGSDDLRFTDEDVPWVAEEARLARRRRSRPLRAVRRESLRRVVEAQETERKRLARELHDETGQALTSLLLGLRTAEETRDEAVRKRVLSSLRDVAATTLQDVRRLAVEHPAEGARRLRARARARAPRRGPPRADRARDRDRRSALRTPAGRRRDRPLSRDPGSAHERRQARGRPPCQRSPDTEGRGRHRRDRGRRRRIQTGGGRRRPRPRPRGHAGADGARGRTALDRERARPGYYHRRGGSGSMIRVLIVDDHAVVRSGLRMLLEHDEEISVVAEAGNGEEAIDAAREQHPDVVLLDVVMPGTSGIEATPAILEASPASKVLVLSMQDDPRYVREAFGAGAMGYVLKEAAESEVVQAVKQVAAGGNYVHPALGARLAAAEAKAQAQADADPLSEREREVLRLLALGHTNQEIAKMLYISVRTAETHRAHIMQKLRLSTRAELVRRAIASGLLDE